MWRPSPSAGTRSSETSSMPARSLAGSPWRNGASPHCGGSLCRCYASRACRASVPSSGSSAAGRAEIPTGVHERPHRRRHLRALPEAAGAPARAGGALTSGRAPAKGIGMRARLAIVLAAAAFGGCAPAPASSPAGALGLPAAGERLVADVTRRLEAVRARVADLPPRRVLMIVGHRPLVAVGRGTLQDELLTMAGGVNVAADAGQVWPTLTLELVVARAPEVIVDASMGSEVGARELFAGLTTVPAVQSGRVVMLADETFLRAGPRVPEAAAALARAIHPEAFAG